MTIKEVAKQFGLTPDTLRYYEKVGLIGPIKKTPSGIRNFDEEDLKRIEFVKCMRSAELPVDVLVTYLKLFELGDETVEERRKLLMDQQVILQKKAEDLQTALQKLEQKIALYDQKILDNYLNKEEK